MGSRDYRWNSCNEQGLFTCLFVVVEYPYVAGQTIHVLTNWRERLGKSQ